jgi:hypothetical protein
MAHKAASMLKSMQVNLGAPHQQPSQVFSASIVTAADEAVPAKVYWHRVASSVHHISIHSSFCLTGNVVGLRARRIGSITLPEPCISQKTPTAIEPQAASPSWESRGRGLDPNPRIGLLLLDYILEGQRSHVEGLASRIRPPERNIVRSYERQRDEDLKYVREENKASIVKADADIAYIQKRWRLKIAREENNERLIPQRLEAALIIVNTTMHEGFEIARDLGNPFAYVRGTRDRFHLKWTNFDDAEKRAGLFDSRWGQEVGNAGDVDIEIHEYNTKSRERDLSRRKQGSSVSALIAWKWATRSLCLWARVGLSSFGKTPNRAASIRLWAKLSFLALWVVSGPRWRRTRFESSKTDELSDNLAWFNQ